MDQRRPIAKAIPWETWVAQREDLMERFGDHRAPDRDDVRARLYEFSALVLGRGRQAWRAFQHLILGK